MVLCVWLSVVVAYRSPTTSTKGLPFSSPSAASPPGCPAPSPPPTLLSTQCEFLGYPPQQYVSWPLARALMTLPSALLSIHMSFSDNLSSLFSPPLPSMHSSPLCGADLPPPCKYVGLSLSSANGYRFSTAQQLYCPSPVLSTGSCSACFPCSLHLPSSCPPVVHVHAYVNYCAGAFFSLGRC